MENNIETYAKELFKSIINEPDIESSIREIASGNKSAQAEPNVRGLQKLLPPRYVQPDNSQSNNAEALEKLDKVINIQKKMEKSLSDIDSNLNNRISAAVEAAIKRSAQNDAADLRAECKSLREDNRRKDEDYSRLQSRLTDTEKKNKELQKQYDSIAEKTEPLQEFLSIWDKMNELNDEGKVYLKRLCGSFSPLALLSLGRDSSLIKQLWQYIKNFAVKQNFDKETADVLSSYFYYSISVYNSCIDEDKQDEQLVLFEIAEGEEYRSENCIKTSDSKQIGNVRRTIVKGVKKKDNTVFQPIVEVR